MIQSISFKNYKVFKEWQELELRPITLLIGKNSSGKSAIAKLPTLIETSLKGDFPEALRLKNDKVELGREFRDLLYGRPPTGVLELKMTGDGHTLHVTIGAESKPGSAPEVASWSLKGPGDSEISRERKHDFSGFMLKEEMQEGNPLRLELFTDYLGPFRYIPEAFVELDYSKDILKIGPEGRLAYEILVQDSLNRKSPLLDAVDAWFKENFEGWGIGINHDRAPLYHAELNWNNTLKINIRDVGEGMCQVLPLVTRAMMPANPEDLIIIEQPELHLHPAAHGNLAQLFAEKASEGNGRYLIESHSKNFILRLRRLVAEKKLKADDLRIYYVDFDEEEGASSLVPIPVDELGMVTNWPEHVFSESLDEAIALRQAQKMAEL